MPWALVAALSLSAYRQRGGYVIAGVVVGVHAPIDGEKIHLFGVYTGYGELRKIAIDGAVRVNQRVAVRVAGP